MAEDHAIVVQWPRGMHPTTGQPHHQDSLSPGHHCSYPELPTPPYHNITLLCYIEVSACSFHILLLSKQNRELIMFEQFYCKIQ